MEGFRLPARPRKTKAKGNPSKSQTPFTSVFDLARPRTSHASQDAGFDVSGSISEVMAVAKELLPSTTISKSNSPFISDLLGNGAKNEESFALASSSLPLDWSLKTSARFTSAYSFLWCNCLNPEDEFKGLNFFIRSKQFDENEMLHSPNVTVQKENLMRGKKREKEKGCSWIDEELDEKEKGTVKRRKDGEPQSQTVASVSKEEKIAHLPSSNLDSNEHGGGKNGNLGYQFHSRQKISTANHEVIVIDDKDDDDNKNKNASDSDFMESSKDDDDDDGDEKEKIYPSFQYSLFSWIHPSSKLPPSLIHHFLSFSGKKNSAEFEYFNQRKRSWQEAFRSVYYNLINGHCYLFYVHFDHFVIAFFCKKSSDHTRSYFAFISNSTKGLRNELRKQGVRFSLPLHHHKKMFTSHFNGKPKEKGEEKTEDIPGTVKICTNNEKKTETEDGFRRRVESVIDCENDEKETSQNSLHQEGQENENNGNDDNDADDCDDDKDDNNDTEGNTENIEDEVNMDIDNNSKSLLLFLGLDQVHSLFDFVMNFRDFVTTLSITDFPQIFSPSPFLHASIYSPKFLCKRIMKPKSEGERDKEKNKVGEKLGVRKETSIPGTKTDFEFVYTLETQNCIICPWVLRKLCKIFHDSQKGDYQAYFKTDTLTLKFNQAFALTLQKILSSKDEEQRKNVVGDHAFTASNTDGNSKGKFAIADGKTVRIESKLMFSSQEKLELSSLFGESLDSWNSGWKFSDVQHIMCAKNGFHVV